MATIDKKYNDPTMLRDKIVIGNNKTIDLSTFSKNYLGLPSSSKDKFNQYNRFRTFEGEDFATGGISYVFFTRPQLYIQNNDSVFDSFLYMLKTTSGSKETEAITNAKQILDALDLDSNAGSFIKLLTNSVLNFETKDVVLSSEELYENFIGQKMSIPGSTTGSTVADSFNIEYNEYSDMSITFLHKAWVDYIHLVKRGFIKPHRKNAIRKRIIDYMCSVYYFKLDESGKKIKYFAKYTGVYPTNIPYSAFSYHHGEPKVKTVSIQYNYSFKEDMDFDILYDFQKIAGSASPSKNEIPTLKDNWNNGVKISNDLRSLIFK